MKLNRLALVAVVLAGVAAVPVAHADTLKKIADGGKMTVAYRESSVPFSYLAGGSTAVGFSVDVTNAVIDAVKKT